jgi:GNAT superfamily N-acetyltransferase
MVLGFLRIADYAVCHLESFAVHKDFRGKGLGTQAIY